MVTKQKYKASKDGIFPPKSHRPPLHSNEIVIEWENPSKSLVFKTSSWPNTPTTFQKQL